MRRCATCPKPPTFARKTSPLLDGVRLSEDDATSDESQSVRDQVAAAEKRSRRHVWIVDEEDPEKLKLKAVEVTIGVSDYKHSELIAGELKAGDQLVVGKTTAAQQAAQK